MDKEMSIMQKNVVRMAVAFRRLVDIVLTLLLLPILLPSEIDSLIHEWLTTLRENQMSIIYKVCDFVGYGLATVGFVLAVSGRMPIVHFIVMFVSFWILGIRSVITVEFKGEGWIFPFVICIINFVHCFASVFLM